MVQYKTLSETWFFIVLTYFFALLPWTVLTALDFISADWRTVQATRRSGWYHFCFVLIPIPLIIFYILVFWEAMDFTESCAAFLGLCVSFVHLIRTSWGLWQIYLFHSWATEAIESLEHMGHVYKLRSPNKRKIPNQEGMTAAAKADLIQVNNSIIDNQLFHGYSQCYIEYRGKSFCVKQDPYGEKLFWKRWLEGLLIIFQLPFVPFLWVFDLICFEVKNLFHQFTRRDNYSQRPKVLHLPFKPVDVWLNWSTVFASQGLNEWIEEFQVARDPNMDQKNVNDKQLLYEGRRDYFAGELFAGICHLSKLGDDSPSENLSMLWECWDEDSAIARGIVKKNELLRAACETGKGLPFQSKHILYADDPKKDIVEGLEGGEEFQGYKQYNRKLQWVIGSLPVTFGQEIHKFDVERLEWLTILLYLGRVKAQEINNEQTDANDDSKIKTEQGSLEVSKDEDSVCVHIDHDSGTEADPRFLANETNTDNVVVRRSSDSLEHHDFDLAMNLPRATKDTSATRQQSERLDPCPERYLPFQNLCSQLGFSADNLKRHRSKKNHDESEKNQTVGQISSFAFSEIARSQDCMIISRTNRHALRTGEMIDIWMQLEAGKHYKFLQETSSWWKTECRARNIQKMLDESMSSNGEIEMNIRKAEISEDEHQLNSRATVRDLLRERQKRAESLRLGYQLVDEDQNYGHLEHSLTFMGDGMEFLRSELAHWVTRRSCDELQESWRPLICSTELNKEDKSKQTLGMLSKSFSRKISTVKKKEWFERRSTQVRLLWEIQELVQKRLANATMNDDGGPRNKMAMLQCILGFPALTIHMEEVGLKNAVEVENSMNGNCIIWFSGRNKGRERDGKERLTNLVKMYVRPQCAPQALEACFELQKNLNGRIEITGDIQCNDGATEERFEWEFWRDAFFCRLEGLRNWQETHQFPYIPCEDSTNNIEAGIEEVQVSGMGTGKTLRIWKGWKPFRKSICRFELESPGFVLEYKQLEPFQWEWNVYDMNTVTEQFPIKRLDRMPIGYNYAGWRDLHNCFLTLKDVLDGAQDHAGLTENGGNGIREGNVESAMERAEKLLNGDQEGVERAVLLLREAAMEERDAECLEKCVRLLCEGVQLPQDLEAAVELLQGFVTYGKNSRCKKDVLQRVIISAKVVLSCSNYLFAQNKTRAEVFDMTRLGCFKMGGSDEEMKERFYFLLGTLRRRFLCHHEKTIFKQLAIVQEDVWQIKNTQQNNRVKDTVDAVTYAMMDDNKNNLLDEMNQDDETAEIRDDYFLSCRVYERGINLLCQREEGIFLMNEYALQLESGLNEHYKNTTKSKRLYERAISEGDHHEAMNNLSQLLINDSNASEADTKRGNDFCNLAIQRGNVTAMLNLGSSYQYGLGGVEKNLNKATELYELAITHGSYLGLSFLAHLYEETNDEDTEPNRKQNIEKAVQLYERAINEGEDTSAMNDLANLLENGTGGIKKDLPRAKKLYERAINEGQCADAMVNLAYLYEDGGEGVSQDKVKAKELYEDAIKAGRNSKAMNNLGVLLQHGAKGVRKEVKRARMLYECAIRVGEERRSMYHLGSLLESGDEEGVERDVEAARRLYEQAIDLGDMDAMLALGRLLEYGKDDVKQDLARTVELYRVLVVEWGNEKALRRLVNVLENGRVGCRADPGSAVVVCEEAMKGPLRPVVGGLVSKLVRRGVLDSQLDKDRAREILEELREKGEEGVGKSG